MVGVDINIDKTKSWLPTKFLVNKNIFQTVDKLESLIVTLNRDSNIQVKINARKKRGKCIFSLGSKTDITRTDF